MTDPILKKAMEKRDEALREVERWEGWIRAYVELSDPAQESLDIPMASRSKSSLSQPVEGMELAPALRVAASSEVSNGNGKTLWPRSQ
jgi:hypothetical protein